MIDVKTIIKPKGAATGAAPTGAAQAGRAVRTADEALHAAHADRAGKAGRADSAAYADKAGDAQTARWAAVADAVRGEFLSSKADDAAEGVITFLKGLLLGDGTRGIDADGNATLGGVTAEAADIARAAIRRMTSDVAFERLATFARGLVATMIESPGYEAGARGFGLHKTEGGRYRLEVDELMVRVKAMFDELEVRRLSYSGGCMVLSAAASRICRVRPLRHGEGAGPYAWRCYFAKDDGTMRTRNWWRVGDQAKCQTMNIDGPEAARARLLALGDRPVSADGDGTPLGWRAPRTGNAGNRYYWRLVTAVGTETLDDGREYDWVELSNERAVTLAGADGGSVDCVGYDTTFDGGDADGMKWHADANDAPMAGDEIVQQGSQTDPGRQHLILLSAVGERAPSIEEYAGVGRSDGPGPYSLTGRCMTSMSPRSGNMFRARRFEIETDGGAVRVPCHRGAWQAGIHYSYYDQVGHAGGLWLCVAPGGTESEPGHGGGWEQQVAPGKDGTPGRDGADNAVRAWLSPVSLVATETAPGVFELSESVLALNVVRGTGDDITGECRVVSARGMGCTASVDGVDTVEVTGATGDGGTIAVVAGVALPGGGVVECRVTDIQVVPDVAVMVGTRLTQTADGIAMLVGGMAKGLQATGIDIANRKVTVTADSFMVMNNRGEATAAVDADGNLVAGSLKAGGKAGGKASVAMGVDGEGKPYLVGTNARGEVVWRLDGNGYVNSTPDVAMAVAGGRAYFANRMDGGYDIRYEVGVRVTNRQLAQVTFTPGGHLGCYIQKSRTEQSAWVALAQKEAVAIASGASGVVTFSGASTVGGSRGAAPAVPFGNGDTLDVRLCYKGEGRGVGLVTCGLEA